MAANPVLHVAEGMRIRGESVHWQASVDEGWGEAEKKWNPILIDLDLGRFHIHGHRSFRPIFS